MDNGDMDILLEEIFTLYNQILVKDTRVEDLKDEIRRSELV